MVSRKYWSGINCPVDNYGLVTGLNPNRRAPRLTALETTPRVISVLGHPIDDGVATSLHYESPPATFLVTPKPGGAWDADWDFTNNTLQTRVFSDGGDDDAYDRIYQLGVSHYGVGFMDWFHYIPPLCGVDEQPHSGCCEAM